MCGNYGSIKKDKIFLMLFENERTQKRHTRKEFE